MSTAEQATNQSNITLYSSINSDCSTRLRLALAWKELVYTHIDCGSPFDHTDRPPEYANLNPTGAVPTLVAEASDGTTDVITQSVAALEYLDEAYPSTRPLLPRALADRARARSFAAIIASDTHPLTAPRVTRQLKAQYLNGAQETEFTDWRRHWIYQGLQAYERLLAANSTSAGLYSIGDEVSVADICLLPEAWRAQGYGITLDDFPLLKRIVANLNKNESLCAQHWDRYK